MVGVLIEMRAAITRRQATGARVIGTLALVLFVTLLAVGTLLAGVKHYRYDGAGANVVATLCFGWLLGWVTGPLLIGDDSTLRMDYFKLLPIPARKLAYAKLGAVFGPVISSRRGRDFTAMLLALLITLLSLASSLVPFVAARLTDGHSPVLADVVRILPSGWGAVAVDAASRADWGLTAASLGGLAALIAVLVLAWPWVLAAEPALVIGCAGLLALVGAWSVNGPAPDGGPSPARVLKTHLALVAIPVVVLFPAAALLIPGALAHSLLLRWLAVPVAIAWAGFLTWYSTQAAVRRLESHARRSSPACVPPQPSSSATLGVRWCGIGGATNRSE